MPFQDILYRHEDIRKTEYRHEILVKGSDFEACKKKVLLFFEKYQLVRYSNIAILENESLSAADSGFENRLNEAILKNQQIVNKLVEELQAKEIKTLNDLKKLPQGYKSKMLHVITHFLDGFFGIDTYFYSLGDDSHWVTEESLEKIKASPSDYWLLSLEAKI
jgi:hypothetical protein